jgi:SAM-dependent methyltransferase
MSAGYTVAYRVGFTPWEHAAEAAHVSFAALLDREEVERSRPFGRALDLGCGRGAHTHELARRGWQAVGIDNVPRAIEAATRKERSGASFAVGDVTHLRAEGLGSYDFFLDVGCLHGLRPAQRIAAGQEISSLANVGATLLMLAFQPTHVPFLPGGVAPDDISEAFPTWELLTTEPADTTGMPPPMRKTAPQWYRLRHRPAPHRFS